MKLSHLLIGGIAGVVAVQIIGAKLVSTGVEAGVRRTVQAYSEQARFPIEVANFEGGWFSSSFDVRVPIPAVFVEPLAELGIEIDSDTTGAVFDYSTNIKHGPIVFDDGIHFSAAHASGTAAINIETLMDKAIAKAEDDKARAALKMFKPQLAHLLNTVTSTYDIAVAFNGDVSFTSEMSGGNAVITNFPQDEKIKTMTFDFSPATGSWTLMGDQFTSIMEANWGGVNLSVEFVEDEHIKFTMGEIDLRSKTNRIGESLWSGDIEATIETMGGFGAIGGNPFDVRFDTIAIASSIGPIDDAKGLVSGSTLMTTQALKVVANGGTLSLDGLTMDVNIQNLLIPILEAEAKVARDSWTNISANPLEDQPFTFLQSPEFETVIDQQLAATPRINLTAYKIVADDEEIGLSGYLQLNPGATLAMINENHAAWPLIEGDFTFLLSPRMVKSIGFGASQMSPNKMPQEQIDQLVDLQLAQYQQLGLVKAEGEIFTSNVNIANDIISVNGKPMVQISQMVAASQQAANAAPSTE